MEIFRLRDRIVQFNQEQRAKQKVQELGNLEKYPDFPHAINCQKTNGIRAYLVPLDSAGFLVGVFPPVLQGSCRDCGNVTDLNRLERNTYDRG